MRSRDLDLERQGQGHTKVTKVKKLQNLRFSPDCEHAECGAIARSIAIFKFSAVEFYSGKKNFTFCVFKAFALIVNLLNLAHIYLR